MQYLVEATGGPGFAAPEEALAVLEGGILPTFDHMQKLMEEGVIVAGGLPVADRSFVFIAEAASSGELDDMLRDIPAWGVLNWKVTPLQSLASRAAKERAVVAALKEALG